MGILQPVLVRPIGDEFELIAGERRWRAARRLGIGRMPALVRESDDAAALEQALVENVHRADLNALEEAAAYQQLIEDFSLTHDAVATGSGGAGPRSPTPCGSSSSRRRSRSTSATEASRWVTPGPCSAPRTGRFRNGSPDRPSGRAGRSERSSSGPGPVAATGGASSTASTPTGATNPLRPPGLEELEGLLGDHLDTRVRSRWVPSAAS